MKILPVRPTIPTLRPAGMTQLIPLSTKSRPSRYLKVFICRKNFKTFWKFPEIYFSSISDFNSLVSSLLPPTFSSPPSLPHPPPYPSASLRTLYCSLPIWFPHVQANLEPVRILSRLSIPLPIFVSCIRWLVPHWRFSSPTASPVSPPRRSPLWKPTHKWLPNQPFLHLSVRILVSPE